MYKFQPPSPDTRLKHIPYGEYNEKGQAKDRFGEWRDVLFLDYETFYGKGYSLSHMTYTDYFRDERFKFHGVGIAINFGEIKYYKDIELEMIIRDLPIEDMIMVNSNAMFDASLTLWAFGRMAFEYHDIMNFGRAFWPGQGASLGDMAKRAFPNDPSKQKGKELANFKDKRDLNDKQQMVLGGYCKQDIHATRCLYYETLLCNMPMMEIRIQHETLMLYLEPKFEADIAILEEALADEIENKKKLIKFSGYPKSRLSSNEQFLEILENDLGLEVPVKLNIKGDDYIPALGQKDPDFIRLMANNPQFKHIWDARQAVKSTLIEKRAERLIDLANASNGMIPVPLNYYGAHTGRWSGGQKVNLQNLNRGGKLRQALQAPKGYKVYVADSSNIEARMISWLAGETKALEMFRRGEDTYNDMATKIYGYAVNRKEEDEFGNKTHRFDEEGNVGKTARLGLGFGMGPPKFQYTLASGPMGSPPIYKDMKFCQNAVNTFRQDNPNIVAYWGVLQQVIYDMMLPKTDYWLGPVRVMFEQIIMPNGLALKYPNIRYVNKERSDGSIDRQLVCDRKDGQSHQKLYGGILSENITQALARTVVAEQGLQAIDTFDDALLALLVHDEIVMVMPEDNEEERVETLLNIMRTPPEWCADLPLDSEGGAAQEYSK